MKKQYGATSWYTNTWVTSAAICALVYAALTVLKIDPETVSRFFNGALISAAWGFISVFLMPKSALHDNRFVVDSIMLTGAILGSLTSLVWVVIAAPILYGLASIVIHQHRRSSSVVEQ